MRLLNYRRRQTIRHKTLELVYYVYYSRGLTCFPNFLLNYFYKISGDKCFLIQ